jgi:hypothetical protein
MSSSTIPNKTQLGIDELRHRTRRLSQRHRTMLFLIDGQRPLSQVLSLAQQAGAATSHFEELVMLGLVELPIPASPPADEEPDLPQVESVELPVVGDEVLLPVEAAPAPISVAPAPVATEPAPPIAAPAVAEAQWERTIRLQGPPTPVDSVEAPPQTPPPAPIAAPAATTAAPPAPEPPPKRRPRRAQLPVLEEVDEGAMLQQVRDLLVDTLRLDAPLFGARTFVRVRAAQTSAELIELVWEIEHHLSRARHGRKELLSLQRARELLGLGNTLVADDNRPGYLDDL